MEKTGGIPDVLHDLVPFVQLKNVKNTCGGMLQLQATKSNTPP